jgi:2-amino-4-hydroxy-6-hydroxymethyldihydropteridine diphosphokinase
MKVVISLGSNIGDRQNYLAGAIERIKEYIFVEKVSEFIETNPVGGPEQPDYLNAVLIGESDIAPMELLEICLAIESEFGRVREIHWGPRTLDLDLIIIGELQIESEKLNLPHPRAHEREFVLAPWLSIDPDGAIPGKGLISELLAALK